MFFHWSYFHCVSIKLNCVLNHRWLLYKKKPNFNWIIFKSIGFGLAGKRTANLIVELAAQCWHKLTWAGNSSSFPSYWIACHQTKHSKWAGKTVSFDLFIYVQMKIKHSNYVLFKVTVERVWNKQQTKIIKPKKNGTFVNSKAYLQVTEFKLLINECLNQIWRPWVNDFIILSASSYIPFWFAISFKLLLFGQKWHTHTTSNTEKVMTNHKSPYTNWNEFDRISSPYREVYTINSGIKLFVSYQMSTKCSVFRWTTKSVPMCHYLFVTLVLMPNGFQQKHAMLS